MCDCYENQPVKYNETKRKARKAHECSDCKKTINIGEQYTYISGIWDGKYYHFKECHSCKALFDRLSSLGYCLDLGGLIDSIYEDSSIVTYNEDSKTWLSQYEFLAFDDHGCPVHLEQK